MYLFGRRMILRAPEDGENAGGDGTVPPPPPDPNAKLMEMLAQIQKRQEATEALIAAQVQQHKPVEPPEDPGYVDPDVEKRLAGMAQGVVKRIDPLQDRLDRLEFEAATSKMELTAEEIARSEAVFQDWRARGVNFAGASPTRQEALALVLGTEQFSTKRKARLTAAAAEELRRTHNADAGSERGGAAPRQRSKLDPATLSADERLKAGGYWEQELGDQEF
jgi:hypothetical protein